MSKPLQASENAAAGSLLGRIRQSWSSPIRVTCLMVVLFQLFVRATQTDQLVLKFEHAVWLPSLQLIMLVTTLAWCGPPQTARQWIAVMAGHALMALTTYGVLFDHYEWVHCQFWWLVLRLTVALLWMSPVLGGMLLVNTIRRGTLRWQRWVPRMLRLCLASTMVLISLESVAAWMESQQQRTETFPDFSRSDRTDGVTAVAAIGGSTMQGFPYAPHWGICQVAEMQLRHRFPEQEFDFQNLAVPGIALAEAVSKLDELRSAPDILVVYSGHNEFFRDLEELRHSGKTAWPVVDDVLMLSPLFRMARPRLVSLSLSFVGTRDMSVPFRTQTWPAFVESRRLLRHETQLQRLFEWAADQRIAVIYCVPASDEATCAPLASLCRSRDKQRQRHLISRWEKVIELQRQRQWAKALAVCETELQSEPAFAHLQYLAGRSLRELGDEEAARVRFQLAKERDQFPIRMRGSYEQAARDVAPEHGVTVVDCPQILRAAMPNGLLDRRCFLDGVHPNLETSYSLGVAVADAITAMQAEWTKTSPKTVPDQTTLTFDECLAASKLNTAALADAYETTAKVLKRYSGLSTTLDDQRLSQAAQYSWIADQLTDGAMIPADVRVESIPRSSIAR